MTPTCINLRERFGQQYRIGFDEAAEDRIDPWTMTRPWPEVAGMRLRYVVLPALCWIAGSCVFMLQEPNMPIWIACTVGVWFGVYCWGVMRAWDEQGWLVYDFPRSKEKRKQSADDEDQVDPPPPSRKR